MSYENPEELNYDCNYNMFLAKHLLTNLKNCKDRQKAVKWMRYLSTCNTSLKEMKLRNDFMYYLVVNIQNYTLEPPFDKDPPQGHLTQHEHLLPVEKTTLKCAPSTWQTPIDDQAEVKGSHNTYPFLYKHSPDGGSFLASQPIPRCGAFCYLAVVTQPK